MVDISEQYSPMIIVEGQIEGNHAIVSVSDNGKGWPKDNRQRLLEPYMTTREKGTGLGLAIVAKIIEQHGGSVELIDSEPDPNGRVGACVMFTLPLQAPVQAIEDSSTGAAPDGMSSQTEEPLFAAVVEK